MNTARSTAWAAPMIRSRYAASGSNWAKIEAALTRQPGVGTAAVILRQDEGIERLVAYLIVDDAEVTTGAALRATLATSLPPYMVPSHVEMLDEMPRLTSGKIDRKALRARPLELPAGAPR